MEARVHLSSTTPATSHFPVQPGQWLLRIHAAKGTPGRQVRALDDALSAIDSRLRVRQHLGRRGLVLVKAPRHLPFKYIRSAAKNLRGFIHIEPNVLLSAAAIPQDERFNEQYGLHNTGQTGGFPRADIRAPDAWDITTGDPSVIVAVLDSGVDYNHPDLAHAIWTNPAEIPFDNIDNDHNGFIDDHRGWDFTNGDADPFDDYHHGTHIAGTIAAAHGSVGTAGIAPGVRILPLKMLDASGNGTIADAVAAIHYATMMRSRGVNIRVSNNSWGDYAPSASLYEAIQEHEAAGILFIAAAGNNARDIDAQPYNPAAFDLPNILSVASTDSFDELSTFSNFGETSVDIAAPGTEILGPFPNSGYSLLSGTSMSAPHVAGIAALAFSISPQSIPYDIVRDAILEGGTPLASLAGKTVTGRRVDAFQTLLQLPLVILQSTPAAADAVAVPPTQFTLRFSHPVDPASLSADDFTVNAAPADAADFIDPRTVRFSFTSSPVSWQGLQTMAIAEDALARLADGAGTDAWSSSFWYDVVPLEVAGSSPASGAAVAPPRTTLDLTFTEPVAPGSIDPSDLVLSHGSVISAALLNPATLRFTLAGLDAERQIDWSLQAGALWDQYGNPSRSAAGTFTLDHSSRGVPVPLLALEPLASRAHASPPLTGVLHAATDVDMFTLSIDAEQTFTVEVVADGALRPHVAIVNSENQLLASDSAPAGASRVLLQQIPAATPGTYNIVVSSAGGTAGGYTLRLWLNAALEVESHGGSSNDTPATAHPISPDGLVTILGRTERPLGVLPEESEPNDALAQANSASRNFIAAPPNLHHMLVRGSLPIVADRDHFSLGILSPGDVLTIALGGGGTPRGTLFDPFLQLYRGDPAQPVLVDEDDDNGAGSDSLLHRFPVSVEDTYYLRVRPYPNDPITPDQVGTYELSLLLETARPVSAGSGVFSETEFNNQHETANDIADVWRPVTHASTTTGSIGAGDTDYLAYTFQAGDLVTIRIDGDDAADPAVRLRSTAGDILAYDDGHDSTVLSDAGIVAFSIPTAGTYYVGIVPSAESAPTMFGQYTAIVSVSAATAPPPPPPDAGDFYSLSLVEGEHLGASVHFTGADGHITLRNADGDALSTDFNIFTAPATGTYYLHLQGPAGQDYAVSLSRNGIPDPEPNDTAATAANLDLTSRANGFLGADDEDWWSFTASAAGLIHLQVSIPAAGAGEFANPLVPILELYAPDGSFLDSSGSALLHRATAAGVYHVRLRASAEGGAYSLHLANFTTGLRGTPGNDVFQIGLDSSSQFVQVRVNTDPVHTLPIAALPSLNLLGLGGDDRLIIDHTHRNPIPDRSLFLAGTFALESRANASNTLRFATLDIASGSSLDVGGADLILHSADPAAILNLITSGRLATSLATPTTTLATTPATLFTTFNGQAVAPTDVLVKFTYYGDSNLDGRVSIADFLRIDRGYARRATGWLNGDFDQNGVIDGGDFFLIDQSFLSPGPTL